MKQDTPSSVDLVGLLGIDADLADAIRREVDAAPPPSAEQIEQLRGLLPAPTGS